MSSGDEEWTGSGNLNGSGMEQVELKSGDCLVSYSVVETVHAAIYIVTAVSEYCSHLNYSQALCDFTRWCVSSSVLSFSSAQGELTRQRTMMMTKSVS
jgi:hypothetical protein